MRGWRRSTPHPHTPLITFLPTAFLVSAAPPSRRHAPPPFFAFSCVLFYRILLLAVVRAHFLLCAVLRLLCLFRFSCDSALQRFPCGARWKGGRPTARFNGSTVKRTRLWLGVEDHEWRKCTQLTKKVQGVVRLYSTPRACRPSLSPWNALLILLRAIVLLCSLITLDDVLCCPCANVLLFSKFDVFIPLSLSLCVCVCALFRLSVSLLCLVFPPLVLALLPKAHLTEARVNAASRFLSFFWVRGVSVFAS